MIFIKNITFFTMVVIFGLFLINSNCAISSIFINPYIPNIDDNITLTGMANPNEDINCQAWFEVNPMVSPPYYGYIMNNVEIPNTPNNFKVIGENVNDLSISVKMGIWVTKSANANSEGIATVSQSNVPTGTYDIKIWGTVKDTSKPIKLKIIASTTVKADDNGNFKYSYKVINAIPKTTILHLTVGNISKNISIAGHKLYLNKGWNAISVPYNSNISFSNNSNIKLIISYGNQKWILNRNNSLNALYGYFIYTKNDTEMNVYYSNKKSNYSRIVYKGYNLIGTTPNNNDWNLRNGNIPINELFKNSNIYYRIISTEGEIYQNNSYLKPFKTYWLFTDKNTTLSR
ncbi:hypothetical protein [Methanothermococcus okinawensis]|uniref:Uncharacterized protein n=1 Tax=Methanothermococcus okinawensis (strain DSM 14208 / JCM 11175 / IH1) TaxID=647113 RepID=F8ALL3_METOI|nr:hypothetical protein [Methanothermococcus okinawensis]AEH07283.1 hypothetical protein Metok_1317 [Methanothermococcus okinawensis IH1]